MGFEELECHFNGKSLQQKLKVSVAFLDSGRSLTLICNIWYSSIADGWSVFGTYFLMILFIAKYVPLGSLFCTLSPSCST